MNPPTDPVADRRPIGLSGRGSNDGELPLTHEATIAAARADILKELMKGETKTSAVTVALVDDQRILWTEAFGSIDQTRGLTPTTETLFCIASCSKVIATVAVMIQEYVNSYANGLFSTASDMGRLAMMFLNGGRLGDWRILSTEAIAEMGRDQTLNLPFNPITDHHVHFGLGWDGVRQGGLDAIGVTAWYKAGDADHYHSFFVVAPDERLAVAVLLTNGVEIGSVAGILAERIMLNALAERGSITKVPSPPEIVAPPAVPATAEDVAAIAGIYASSYVPRRLAPQADGTLTLSNFVGGQWQPFIEGLRLREGGRFVSDQHPETAYRMIVAANRRYLAARRPGGLGHYDMELPDSHDLPPRPPLSARWQARVGRRWLMVDDPYSAFLALGRQSPLFSLVQVPGLDGYIAASLKSAGFELVQVVDPRESDDHGRMCLQIPIDNGWGLNDLVIEVRDGEEWVKWGSIRYRPLATVPALEWGRCTVTVGHEGMAEWRRLSVATAITIDGASVWYLYDTELSLLGWGQDKGAVGKVDNGTYLLLHGAPDTKITLTIEP